MARSGLVTWLSVAGSLSVLALAGCNGPVVPVVSPTASTPPSQPSAAPVASPSAVASTAALPGQTPAPVLSAPPASGKVVTVQGKVFDEEGALVEGARVTVTSLNTQQPYTASATTTNGNYVFNSVPVGVQVRIVATKDGWTSRDRVDAFDTQTEARNVVDFGGTSSTGAPFFISNYPEIASAFGSNETAKGEKVVFTINLSEPLDEENQRRFNEAFAISSEGGIRLTRSSAFLDNKVRASMVWNAAGSSVVYSFDAPQRALSDKDKDYAFTLTRLVGAPLITDKDNKPLGFDNTAEADAYQNIVKASSLRFSTSADTAAKRWDETHNRSGGFSVAEDDTDPTLASVKASTIQLASGSFKRIELTFSEPVQVFGNTASTELTTLANYVLAFGETPLRGTDMEKDATLLNLGTFTLDDLKGFTRNKTILSLTNGTNAISLSTSDARVINIDIPAAKFPVEAEHVRVLVKKTVTDPAGNAISETSKQSDGTADNVKDGVVN